MAKNKRNKSSGVGQQPRGKPKKDGKPKKAKEEDHLQHIPFRLREIMKSKKKMEDRSLKSKKRKDGEPVKTQDGDIPVPHFKRRKHETEKAYVRRMEAATNHVLFLTKNQVERKPELDVDKQERPADKGKSEKKKEYDKVRLLRLQQKKLNRQEAAMEKEMFVDHVPFGEVSMAPPSLNIKPKKAQIKSQYASKGLLLNSLLGNTVSSTVKPSMARQRIMEEERERAVEAYRQLKKRKQQQQQQQQETRTGGLEKTQDF